VDAFGKHHKYKDGRQIYCRDCRKVIAREWYAAHHREQSKRATINKRKTMDNLTKHILTYLQGHPCIDCGESDPLVLDFDHVRGNKKTGVCTLVSNAVGWSQILREIRKCDVRCANCHRRKTARERCTARFRLLTSNRLL